jgi:hypothetical protein
MTARFARTNQDAERIAYTFTQSAITALQLTLMKVTQIKVTLMIVT